MNLETQANLDGDRVWDTERAFMHLQELGLADTKRTAERRLHELGWLPPALKAEDIHDDAEQAANQLVLRWQLEQARQKRRLILFAQLHQAPGSCLCLHANDARQGRYWVPVLQAEANRAPTPEETLTALRRLQQDIGKPVTLVPHGPLVSAMRDLPSSTELQLAVNAHAPRLNLAAQGLNTERSSTPHLKRLEAESIHIIREAVAEAENPVMLYSVGKDSSVMLHLARKAFYPAPPPFPLMHVDTRWKFREMYLFRDYMAQESGMPLLVHINPEAIARDINPFDHGSALHTDITKTEGLKQALDEHRFDVVFGGARRDEEKSRAKERIFSFRTATHRWDPKNQRPELWNLYNTKKSPGESIRVFPISNWTELDIWQYIYQENIPVVPLYFAKPRPVVIRDGMILLVDDNRFRLLPGEAIEERLVRFRTLGCYPLTGAVESSAANLPEILLELINARSSERQGRAIDSDSSGSMEKKKQEGYF